MQYLVLVVKLCFRTYILYETVFRRTAEYQWQLITLFCLIGFYHFLDRRNLSMKQKKPSQKVVPNKDLK